ncbi:SDR family oxidoreductase [Pseudomonas sp.]|uniref:SDR family oxidoreductase n=1 Tax=Pseudomonas sp. TaxID=306 RepID=UPI0024877620|nr:SDR family oxidoreductase [Pseudomonas sp.]MDI1332418.1 SDR family oxidoreductase [Pseudomonas sp.]
MRGLSYRYKLACPSLPLRYIQVKRLKVKIYSAPGKNLNLSLRQSHARIRYSASKATQLSISRSLAEVTKGTAVTVNAVLPGPTETESLKAFIESVNPDLSYAEAEQKFMAENRPSSLIYRLAKPAEVANIVAFLVSERAAVINCAAIHAKGGTVQNIG